MTTGIFLQRLVNNPNSLRSYTHIIMDEVHERDLDIDFSLVVVKHLLAKTGAEALQFKLVLMSATFNFDLFANYFSKSSVQGIEQINSYEGAQLKYDKEEAERKRQEDELWSKSNGGRAAIRSTQDGDEDDEWIETKPDAKITVKKASVPADVIEINARCFAVKDFYLDEIIQNIFSDKNIVLSEQDRDVLLEA